MSGRAKYIDSPCYTNGIRYFMRRRNEIKDSVHTCDICGKDLSNAKPSDWALHHIDWDRNHNYESNFQLLCKSCHCKIHNSPIYRRWKFVRDNYDRVTKWPMELQYQFIQAVYDSIKARMSTQEEQEADCLYASTHDYMDTDSLQGCEVVPTLEDEYVDDEYMEFLDGVYNDGMESAENFDPIRGLKEVTV